MNSTATTFIRACRAGPATSQRLLHARTKTPVAGTATGTTSSSSRVGPTSSTSTRSLAYRHGTRFATTTTRAFSSQRLLKQAVSHNHHNHDHSSAGLDATILAGRASPTSTQDGGSFSTPSPSHASTLVAETSPTAAAAAAAGKCSSSSYDAVLLPSDLPPSDLLFLSTSPTQIATVTRIGTMQKTVRATRNILTFHAPYQKYYTRPTHVLVHDPHNLLHEGDVIRYGGFPPSWRAQRDARGQIVVKRHRPRDRNGVVKELGVRHVVREVVTPFGVPVSQRTERVVGGVPGKWKGTEGEVKKVAVRQKGRKDGSKKARKGVAVNMKKAAASIPPQPTGNVSV
ncbi:hypothetical protein A1O7_04258 [Cladophialophora yegresii CBS 114405]|uniref:Uncharacterized protein n=1 Tax=Cladophialophora yegresii CBS 114405 TaxID=1182544 RepID=W9W6F5_9EURO|nr:uncharacterized protein A1O7_04258 [Cladophialophora yegresii CBS 114405]EXJ60106.1 hypothetical protein A1O7_04258 [Cladophialophora yegresii CBS 114405]